VRLLSPQTRATLDEAHDPVNASGQTRREVLAAAVKEIITAKPGGKPKDPAYKVTEILSVASSLGIEIPAAMANFSRSMLMLAETIDKLNQINESNVDRACDEFDAGETTWHEGRDNAKAALEAAVLARIDEYARGLPDHDREELMKRPKALDASDQDWADVNSLPEDLLGFKGEKVADMTDQLVSETAVKLYMSGDYKNQVNAFTDRKVPQEQKAGFKNLMERIAPLELRGLESANSAYYARRDELEKAREATFPVLPMWTGAERAGRAHRIQASVMLRGNYLQLAFRRAKARDELPNQTEAIQDEAAVDPEVLEFERTQVAAFLGSNSNSVAQMVQARRTEKGGLISQSSD
jgi:hypothetical protein